MVKKVLITGGAGFIGSHLAQKLVEEGEYVIVIDNFYTGNRENISNLLNKPNFKFIKADILFPSEIESLEKMRIDQIYHLACPASPAHYQKDPIKTIKINIEGTINILELAKKTKARILFSSTSEVYGNPLVHPQSESYLGNVNFIGPRACYDEGKRLAETLMMEYYRQYKVDIKIVRIFNTYGPKMNINDGRVVSNFIVQAIKGEPLTVYGDGTQTRSFCYVDDMIEGLIKMMNTQNFIGPVNLGNPVELPILELAKLILKFTKSHSQIVFKTLPIDDPARRRPDINLAKDKLNWSPKIELEAGLKKTIDCFKEKLGGEKI